MWMPTVIAPLIIIALSIPLISGKIGRNYLYGFRTPRTMASDAVWYPANRVGGMLFLGVGVVWLTAGLLVPVRAIAIGLTALGIATAIWFIYMRRLPTS
jgi:uncharacterized membrane protein